MTLGMIGLWPAKALLEMGACYEKLGRSDAQKAYSRVLAEYADQPNSVAQARARLAALELAVHDQKKGPVTEQLEISYSTGGLCLSRDGTKLAYCRYADGRTTGLMVRNLVTGDEIEITPNWYCAGLLSRIGENWPTHTGAKESPRTSVHLYSLGTGEDRSINREGFVRDWSRNGKLLLIYTSPEFSEGGKTYVVPVDAGEAREVSVPLAKGRFSWDSQYISYSDKGKVCLYALEDDQVVEITKGSNAIWCPGGNTLLFLSQKAFGPAVDLCIISVSQGKSAGEVQVIKPDFGEAVLMSLSESGRLLYEQSYQEEHVYSLRVDPQTGQPIARPTRLASGLRAIWSPQGNRIAYLAKGMLHVMSADGSNDQEVIKVHTSVQNSFVWGSNGDQIYIVEWPDNKMGIYAISISTKERKPVLIDKVGHLTCSPDGKQLAFIKPPDPSKYHLEVFAVNVDGSNLRQLTFDEGTNKFYPSWAPDGKSIAFDAITADRTTSLMAVSVADGETRELFHGPTSTDRFFMSCWSPDGNSLVWFTPKKLRIGNVSTGQYQKFETDLEEVYMPSWSPDGTKILLSSLVEVDQLMIMDNFLPEIIGGRSR